MNKVLMTIHGGVRSYRQYWGGNQVIYLNGIYRNTVPFYVENITDSVETLSIVKNNAQAFGVTIEKSSDGDNWTALGTTSTTALTQTLQPGEKLYLRATGSWCSPDNFNYYNHITGVSKVGGNVMSLVYGPYFGAQDKLPHNVKNIFAHILDGNANLQDASELILPALFLQYGCYAYMFKDCVSLEEVPALPATTLAEYCYYHMFEGCSSLEDAPKLLAKELVESCYEGMFYGCSLLNYIECEAADISATGCTDDWVDGVASSGKFVKDYKALWTTGVDGIPASWVAIDDRNTPFFVENITNANETLSIRKNFSISPSITIEKSSDGINWTTFGTTSTTALTQTIQPGERLYLRATANTWCASGSDTYFNSIKGVSKVGGNIMSLLYGSSFNAQTELPQGTNRNFQRIFYRNTNLQDASKLLLPTSTLTGYCYSYMFYGCTALTTTPELPATTLAEYCYQQMFDGCTSLTTAPELPATTLAEYCYYYMFNGCTSLTTAPELPATTLAEYCYSSMFYECTALTTAPELPATTLAARCYHSMFRGCTALTTAPELPATTLAEYCYYAMFYGCSSLTTSPALPAVTLVSNCYAFMFGGCSSLNHIECFAVDNSATKCTNYWVSNVASTGTFVKVFNATWTTGTSGIPSGWTVEVDDTKAPFFVENINNSNETLSIVKNDSNAPTITIEMSSDGLNWTTLGTTSTTALTQTIQPGEKLYLRATANAWCTSGSGTYFNSIKGVSKVGGNTMSLLYGSNFTGSEVSFPDGVNTTHVFYGLFYVAGSSRPLQDASKLILPATTLVEGCYQHMFDGCISLTTAPELPATTLATGCYLGMFYYCSSLTTAPVLPATTLADWCYESMFEYCTSLTTAPVLPATTLAPYCYYQMFYRCTSLTTAPVLPATTLANDCYHSMFYFCSSLTTAPVLPATTLANDCYQGMFEYCTSLTTAPVLPATTLAERCYQGMFANCTLLATAPVLPVTTLAPYCYRGMFWECLSLTTAPELPATTLVEGCYYTMFHGCSNLTYIKCLATDISATNCTELWVGGGVAASGTFIKDANMSSWTTGINGIPSGWTVQDA